MSQPENQPVGGGGAVEAVSISSEVMVVAVVFLFVVVVFVFFLYLYAKRYLGGNSSALLGRSRSRYMFTAAAPLPRRGLDTALLQSLPVTKFRSTDFEEGLECSVCLSELSDGEEVRLLPKCSHGFHLQCIDMWFYSHSTCPLCRSAVGPDPSAAGSAVIVEIPSSLAEAEAEAEAEEGVSEEDGRHLSEPQHLPTNMLFWGTQNRVNTGGGLPASSRSGKREPMLVIEVPSRGAEGFPSSSPAAISISTSSPQLPSSWFPSSSPAEGMKTPTSARMRPLRRLLSRGKRTVSSLCSPSPRGGGGDDDIEQGLMEGAGRGEGGGEGSAQSTHKFLTQIQ